MQCLNEENAKFFAMQLRAWHAGNDAAYRQCDHVVGIIKERESGMNDDITDDDVVNLMSVVDLLKVVRSSIGIV
jgi:hypothetical protein